MKLVVTEKPSVAQSIAKVLGAAKREDGYMEGNGYIVSWCVGHLVELAEPEAYDAKYSKWSYNDLPIFPLGWQYEAGIEDIGTAGAVRCKIDLHSWKSAYKCCVLCDGHTAFGHWRLCDLLHCKGFVAVPAYSCGSWNCGAPFPPAGCRCLPDQCKGALQCGRDRGQDRERDLSCQLRG